MALQDITQPFIWGAGGAKMTPEQIAREREIAEALGIVDTSPVGHWLEGAARMANAAVGRIREGRANRAEQENATYNSDIIASLLGGGSTTPAATTGAATASAPMDPASARVAQAHGDFDLRSGIISTAEALGVDPVDLATAISYETAGTFDPTKTGPTTQWGQHRGLIQFGEPQAQQYGVDWNNPLGSQLGPEGAIAKYLRDTGVQPGMGLLDIYSAINAGGVGRYNRSDANNGGAPGTVADKVNNQMAGHRQKAMALLGNAGMAPTGAEPAASSLTGVPVSPEMPMAGGATGFSPIEQALAQGSPVQTAQAGGIDPAIIQALSDPRASGMTRKIAGMLMQQNMQQQQAEQERMRAEQQAQIEMQQRIQAAQAAGVDPRFIGDDEIWKQAAGAQFREQPTDIREYEYARGQGYQGSFSDFQLEQKRAGATSVDARNMGTIPQGYRMVYDEAGNPVQMEPIPGGPADTSMTDAAAAENRQTSTSIITNAASRAREALRAPGLPATGTAGRMLSALPETNAAELRRQVEVLQSNAKVENLQAMRAASPTGGALGAVSDKENAMLAAKSGALDPDSPTFERDLDDYERTLLRIVHGPRVGDAIFEQSRETQSSKPISEMTDEELEALANGDR